MIIILKPNLKSNSSEYQATLKALNSFPNIEARVYLTQSGENQITEVSLLGDTSQLLTQNIEALPAVLQVIRISNEYKLLGKHHNEHGFSFDYNGVEFSQDTFHIFAGLCAVDNQKNVSDTFKVLSENNQVCTRMGAYKPRTSPYSFQGLGQACLSYVFEAAGKYGVKVIAMEVTHERQVAEIHECLQQTGSPTGVMLQVGTRNAQNFELLRALGQQTTYPILFKRGFGITLHESILAAEYLAEAGNRNVVFCLRGVKSLFGAPHRNLADMAHVSVVKRLTKMPVCFDPSHSIGTLSVGDDQISDISHASAQAVISGANLLLTDIHPMPPEAVVDSKQAISLQNLPWYLEDMQYVRECYLHRAKLAKSYTK
tara:strand:+ start:253942 stop:255054 length:1113 start_codon:yes stop_codon:yes gene_type:complete